MLCAGFSLWWLLLLWSTGSRHAGLSSRGSKALELRLSSCGARAQPLHSMWDPPGPGLEPMPLALAGRFLTTVPPGKPCKVSLTFQSIIVCASHKMEKIWLRIYINSITWEIFRIMSIHQSLVSSLCMALIFFKKQGISISISIF